MNNRYIRIAAGGMVAAAGLTGCAAGVGNVVTKMSGDEAQVSLGSRSVKVGDKVVLYKIVCVGEHSGKADAPSCGKEPVGSGVVTRTLGENDSVVKIDPGVDFTEGTQVEKQ